MGFGFLICFFLFAQEDSQCYHKIFASGSFMVYGPCGNWQIVSHKEEKIFRFFRLGIKKRRCVILTPGLLKNKYCYTICHLINCLHVIINKAWYLNNIYTFTIIIKMLLNPFTYDNPKSIPQLENCYISP